jgi:hypothetical protein
VTFKPKSTSFDVLKICHNWNLLIIQKIKLTKKYLSIFVRNLCRNISRSFWWRCHKNPINSSNRLSYRIAWVCHQSNWMSIVNFQHLFRVKTTKISICSPTRMKYTNYSLLLCCSLSSVLLHRAAQLEPSSATFFLKLYISGGLALKPGKISKGLPRWSKDLCCDYLCWALCI